MRHIISILLQNEAGALARVADLFSARGYNIESLNVAPTDDASVSRLTLITTGSEAVIDQIFKQLGKLVDIVDVTDMTDTDHIERELALIKLDLGERGRESLDSLLDGFSARVLDDRARHFTVEIVGGGSEIDRFVALAGKAADISTVVRSGAMAVTRGAPVFGRD